MKKQYRIMAFLLLAVALAAALSWGTIQTIRQRAYRMQVQTMLERSYYELGELLQEVETELGKLLVSDGARQDVLLLSHLYRQADHAGHELAVLPAGQENREEAMAFVHRLAEYSGALLRRAAQGEDLIPQDEEQIQGLLERCTALKEAVRDTDSGQLVRAVMRRDEMEGSGQEYDEFVHPDSPVPVLLYDGPFSQAAHTTPKALGNKSCDEQEALRIAQQYVGTERVLRAWREQDTAGEIPCWGVAVETKDAGVLHLQITRVGGEIRMMAPENSPGEGEYTVEMCQESAEDFLQRNGYGEMQTAYRQVDFGMVTWNFVPVQEEVLLYPDLVKVQVSMQSGQVVGVECNNYLRNHVERTFSQKRLDPGQIEEMIHTMTVERLRLAVIPQYEREILCYEVCGRYEGEQYIVYLDAETGETREILRVLADGEDEKVV